MASSSEQAQDDDFYKTLLSLAAYDDFVQVSDDGGTLWVHAVDGSTIGRFSKRAGIDVHTTITDQIAGADQCLFCTHEPAGQEDWARFRAAMLEHHGVDIPSGTLVWPEAADPLPAEQLVAGTEYLEPHEP